MGASSKDANGWDKYDAEAGHLFFVDPLGRMMCLLHDGFLSLPENHLTLNGLVHRGPIRFDFRHQLGR